MRGSPCWSQDLRRVFYMSTRARRRCATPRTWAPKRDMTAMPGGLRNEGSWSPQCALSEIRCGEARDKR